MGTGGGKPAGIDQPGRGADLDILKLFAKYGGLGGLGLAVLFLLFGKLTFPKLTAEQATPYMFLVFGVTVACLIIWASKTDKRRGLRYLLALVALVFGVLAWLSLPRKASTLEPFTVSITVVSPYNLPVTDAHVSANLGDGPSHRDGDTIWTIVMPTVVKGQTLTVYADVSDKGWSGSANQLLGDDHSLTMTLLLKENGELPVRGTVLSPEGRVVPNAQVSIVGYEAKPTDANGQFKFDRVATKDQPVHIHAELAPNLVADMPNYKVGSAPAELNLRPIQALGKTPPPPPAKTMSQTDRSPRPSIPNDHSRGFTSESVRWARELLQSSTGQRYIVQMDQLDPSADSTGYEGGLWALFSNEVWHPIAGVRYSSVNASNHGDGILCHDGIQGSSASAMARKALVAAGTPCGSDYTPTILGHEKPDFFIRVGPENK